MMFLLIVRLWVMGRSTLPETAGINGSGKSSLLDDLAALLDELVA